MKVSWIGLRDTFLEQASKPGGCTNADLYALGYSPKQVVDNMAALLKSARVLVAGNRHQRRYFTDAQAFEHYRTAVLPAIKVANRQEHDRKCYERRKASRPVKVKAEKAPKPPKLAKAPIPKPIQIEAKPAPKPPKPQKPKKDKLAINSAYPGVRIDKYVGQKWDKDKPIDGYTPDFKVTIGKSPPHFGPAAKIWGCK